MTQPERKDKEGTKLWRVRMIEENKRQKRQKETEDAINGVQDGITAADACYDASSPAGTSNVRSNSQASEEKVHPEQQNTPSDASDASRPSSFNNKKDTLHSWNEV